MTEPRGARIRVTTLATAVHSPMAWCNDCEWHASELPSGGWRAVRERARRHAAAHGHTVAAEYRTAYVFGVTATAPEGR